ncbi:hypothetical protein [Mesorhizobium loti]|uniref:hypothetical protein n=1 Tax=Rhizobium loti TaxID=381 RepID=UPI0012681CBA
MGQYIAQGKPQGPDLLQSLPLKGAQPGFSVRTDRIAGVEFLEDRCGRRPGDLRIRWKRHMEAKGFRLPWGTRLARRTAGVKKVLTMVLWNDGGPKGLALRPLIAQWVRPGGDSPDP